MQPHGGKHIPFSHQYGKRQTLNQHTDKTAKNHCIYPL